MSHVKELINFSEEVGTHYVVNLEKTLKNISRELEDDLINYLKRKCIEEDTVINNSVHKSIIPFSLKARIKSKESLEEKVIRNDIYFDPIEDETILINFDDLVGITILTTTIGYHELAHKYFISYINENSDIELIGDNNNKKKLFGKDRIQYFHLKIKYKGYPVEIQIKSVFLSAFADIEHTLFYKDFEIYELKSYNKKIMHSLAPILIDLEDILHEIYTQDKSYIELDLVKAKIYKSMDSKKNEILNLDGFCDDGKLNYNFNIAAELLTTYFKGKEISFDGNLEIKGMVNGKDKNIIRLLFEKSIEFEIIKAILDDEDNFFENYLRGELIKDEKYKSKITYLDFEIIKFVNGLNNIINYDLFNSKKMKKKINLKLAFSNYIDIIEKFEMKFDESIESIDSEILNFIVSCIIVTYIIDDLDEIKNLENNIIFKLLIEKENDEEVSLDMELSEKIQEFIIEEWRNHE
ncbi:hypothetical protein [Lysinibacillus capsici]|uniref:hypothetical protein n=1 Tax=Lysinibacillus capsici TaxID=2115968 RepID=UPI002E22C759|nr:hypothetical protein [Lysinibacillus capsici]